MEKIKTAFPSFLFQFTSLSDGNFNLLTRAKDFIIFTKEFSASLSWPGNVVFLITFLLIIYFIKKFLRLFIIKKDFSLFDYSILRLIIIIGILSLRQQIFLVPLLHLSSLKILNLY